MTLLQGGGLLFFLKNILIVNLPLFTIFLIVNNGKFGGKKT
jgi:hypothetical protein